MGRRPFLAATGLVAGLMSGLLGVGGGILMVPALRSRRVGASWAEAAGTSLAAIIPIVAAGLVTYAAAGSVDTVAAAGLAPGAVVGAVIGARAASRIPERALALAFAVICLAAALRLAVPADIPTGSHGLALEPATVCALAGIGVASGLLSGLVGIGGGVVMVPALVLGLDLPQQLSQGSSLAAVLPTATGGAVTHVGLGNVRREAAVVLGVAGAVGAVTGSLAAVHLAQLPLRVAFAGWLGVVAAHTLRQRGPSRR